MIIKHITEDSLKIVWNKSAPHPLQSWEWGEARKKMGIEVIRIGEYEGNRLNKVFQVTFHNIPKTGLTVGYVPRSVLPSEETINFIKTEGNKRNTVFFKFEPYIKKSEMVGVTAWFKKSPHPLFPDWTQMIDLAPSESDLLKNMHHKTRYNINLALKKGVSVKEMTSDTGFEIFIKLYFDTCRRQGYRGHDYNYHRTIFNILKKNIAHIFIAFYKSTPLASFEIFTFNDVMYYPYGGSSLERRNFMAANLLMWEIIRFGKNRRIKIFDLWGSLPPQYENRDSWSGFTRFKAGYGSEFVELSGSYDLIIRPLLYRLYNTVFSFRQKLI